MNSEDEGSSVPKTAEESIEHISHGAGTSRYGNFHNYYDFNPSVRRLKLLTPDWVLPLSNRKQLKAIDVGCNSGDLIFELYSHLKLLNKPLKMLGIDIDPVLISKARELAIEKNIKEVEFKRVDVMLAEDRAQVDDFACHFDVAFCFAVTMWIHLNHGDEGLKKILNYITKKCDFLILEPQPWKCYRNASRRMRKEKKTLFQSIDNLSWRHDILERVDEYIQNECDMRAERSFGTTPWGRPLTMYRARIPKIGTTG